jgi:hypothetical protein
MARRRELDVVIDDPSGGPFLEATVTAASDHGTAKFCACSSSFSNVREIDR